MKKLKGLSEQQIEEISHQVSDAFYDYKYNDEDEGLIKYIHSRENMFIYMNAIVNAAYKTGLLYTTSDKHEGYLMLSGEGFGRVKFFDGLKMISAEKKALGGFGNMKSFIKACFAEGSTIETRMKKAKKKFIRIEMLVVRPEYQGQGFMRKILNDVFKYADKKNLPVILDTDDKDKCARYEHLGMKVDRVRNCGDKFHMYDLIRDTGEKKNISGVPETMIQTLYARAKESKKKKHFIYDEQAIDIVSKLDYDFSKADKDMKMSSGVIARTIMLDKMVKEYISKHPEATVINIACGMDTRVYRVDNAKIRWYNIDLPETINIRKRFLDEEGRIKMIACSAMDEKWADEIGTVEGDVLVVIEGLTMYLSEPDVKKILDIISGHFSNNNVTLFIEFMSPFVVKKIKEKSIDQSGAKFTWGVASGKDIAALSEKISFVEDRSLVEGMEVMYPVYKVIGKIKPVRNISNKIVVLRK